MKYIAVLAVLVLVGCQHALPPNQVVVSSGDGNANTNSTHLPTAKQKYIEDHNCKLNGRQEDIPIVQDDGTIRSNNGWDVYKCPNGVAVVIDHDDHN